MIRRQIPSFVCLVAVLSVIFALGTACSTAPKTEGDRANLHTEVEQTIDTFRFRSKPAATFFKTAYGYAVFPSIGKGGLIAGGAYGKGEVFEQGKLVGYCDMTQGTIGLQLGGQAYAEVIFFQDKYILDKFKSGDFTFAANASAVAIEAQASTAADYNNGVIIYTMSRGGLMGEAAVGGQNFRFLPIL